MTAFEMAGSVARQTGHRTFKRDVIKLAHNTAVELLVSFASILTFLLFQKKNNYSQQDIELCFREGIQSQSGDQKTDQIYTLYQTTCIQHMTQQNIASKIVASAFNKNSTTHSMNKIEEIEPEPEMEQKIKSDAAELEDIQE